MRALKGMFCDTFNNYSTITGYIIDYLKTRLLKFSQISFKRKWLIIVSCVQVCREI